MHRSLWRSCWVENWNQSGSEPAWSLSHHGSPWKRTLVRVHNHAGLLIELLAAVAVAQALARRNWVLLAIGTAAAAEAAMFVVMSEAGFSGNSRYVLPALAVLCVLSGAGLATLLEVRRAGAAVRAGAVVGAGGPGGAGSRRACGPAPGRGGRGRSAHGGAWGPRPGGHPRRWSRRSEPLRPGQREPRAADAPGLGTGAPRPRDRERKRRGGGVLVRS